MFFPGRLRIDGFRTLALSTIDTNAIGLHTKTPDTYTCGARHRVLVLRCCAGGEG